MCINQRCQYVETLCSVFNEKNCKATQVCYATVEPDATLSYKCNNPHHSPRPLQLVFAHKGSFHLPEKDHTVIAFTTDKIKFANPPQGRNPLVKNQNYELLVRMHYYRSNSFDTQYFRRASLIVPDPNNGGFLSDGLTPIYANSKDYGLQMTGATGRLQKEKQFGWGGGGWGFGGFDNGFGGDIGGNPFAVGPGFGNGFGGGFTDGWNVVQPGILGSAGVLKGWFRAPADGSNIQVSVYFELPMIGVPGPQAQPEEYEPTEYESPPMEGCLDEASDMPGWEDECSSKCELCRMRDNMCLICNRMYDLQVINNDCTGICVPKGSLSINALATERFFMCSPPPALSCVKFSGGTLMGAILARRSAWKQNLESSRIASPTLSKPHQKASTSKTNFKLPLFLFFSTALLSCVLTYTYYKCHSSEIDPEPYYPMESLGT